MSRPQAAQRGTTTAPAAASLGGSIPFSLERLSVVMTPLATRPGASSRCRTSAIALAP